MTGLSHLAEAAQALSQLGNVLPAGAPTTAAAPSPSLTTMTSNAQQQQQVPFGAIPLPAGKPVTISDDDESKAVAKATVAATVTATMTTGKKQAFPQRLHAILADLTLVDYITWLPNGESFVIIRPDKFTEEVLPKYLPPVDARSSTKYPSFTRKLNRW